MHKLEAVLEWLRNQAAERKVPGIFQMRISVTPNHTEVLDLFPEPSIGTISF